MLDLPYSTKKVEKPPPVLSKGEQEGRAPSAQVPPWSPFACVIIRISYGSEKGPKVRQIILARSCFDFCFEFYGP